MKEAEAAEWTVSESYYTSGWQLLEVRREADVSRTGTPLPEPSVVTDRYEQYVWSARYIDAPVLRRHDADGDGTFDATYYYTTDANQNVTAELSGPGTVAEPGACPPCRPAGTILVCPLPAVRSARPENLTAFF